MKTITAGTPTLARDPRAFGKVGVLFGGASSEREISLLSGNGVLEALKRRGVDAYGFDPITQPLAELAAQQFDRVFIALHGRGGEDGTLQGALELMKIPYTGSGVLASALAMDKILTKRVWSTHGIPTPEYRVVDAQTDWDEVFDAMGDRLIVKPTHEGSTLGITKVLGRDAEALRKAYEESAKYGPTALVEQLIEGHELTIALLDREGETHALPIVEIRPQDNHDFDYQTKYFVSTNQYLCPAPFSDALSQRIQETCIQAFKVLGGEGWGRVDVMLRASDQAPFLLELNTAPGMTPRSLVPRAALGAGWSYEDICMEILATASLKSGAR